jgi:hypothetical protein
MKFSRSIQSTDAASAAYGNTEPIHNVGFEDRANDIATAAYYKAEQRGFTPNHELDDWLAAEADFIT